MSARTLTLCLLALALALAAAACSGPTDSGGTPDASAGSSDDSSPAPPRVAIGDPCDDSDVCAVEPNAESSCITGECTLVCHDGFSDCDRAPDNGCEQSLTTSTSCGGCFVACDPAHAFGTCLGGICDIASCDLGWGDCDDDVDTGCETPLVTATDCGGCGTPCEVPNATGACDGGTCALGSCDEGWGDCDGDPANGCELALGTDVDCAACGDDCSLARAVASCVDGQCQVVGCDPGWGACDDDPTNGCETSLDTLDHCGGCARPCVADNATEPVCADEACTFQCDPGFGDCDETGSNGCEQPLGTDAHCAGCGDTCVFEHTVSACEDGMCVISACEEGWGDCDDEPGCETPLNTAEACGACHIACHEGHECLETGACGPVVLWTLPPVAADLRAVAIDPTGNVFAAGSADGAAIVASRAPDGGPRWFATVPAEGEGEAAFEAIAVSEAGEATAVGAADGDALAVALSPTGAQRWSHSFGGDTDVDVALGVGVTPAGDVVIAGRFRGVMIILGQPTAGSIDWEDPFVLSFDSEGALRWSKGFAGVTDDDAQQVGVDALGNSYVSGAFDGLLMFDGVPLNSMGPDAAWVASFDADGAARWSLTAMGTVPTAGLLGGLDVAGGHVALAVGDDLQTWSEEGVAAASVAGVALVSDLAVGPDGRVYGVAASPDGAVVTAWTPALTHRWTFELAGPFGTHPRLAVGQGERLAVAGGQAIGLLADGGWAPPPPPDTEPETQPEP